MAKNYFLEYLLREANETNMNEVEQTKDLGGRVKNSLKSLQNAGVFDTIISNQSESASIGINLEKKTIQGFELMKINGVQQKMAIPNVQLSKDIYSPFSQSLPEYRAIKLQYTKKDGLWKIWILPKDSTKNVAKCVYKDGNYSSVQFGQMGNNVDTNNNNQQQSQQNNNSNGQQQQQTTDTNNQQQATTTDNNGQQQTNA